MGIKKDPLLARSYGTVITRLRPPEGHRGGMRGNRGPVVSPVGWRGLDEVTQAAGHFDALAEKAAGSPEEAVYRRLAKQAGRIATAGAGFGQGSVLKLHDA